MSSRLLIANVAGVKVYPRQNQNIRPCAVTACISNVTSQADFSWTLLFGPWCHMDDACTYCMGSDVSILFGYNFTPATLTQSMLVGKNPLQQNKSTSNGHKQGRQADKAGGLVNRCAHYNCQYFCSGHFQN